MGVTGEKHSLDTREDCLFIQATNLSGWLVGFLFVFAEGREQLEDLFFSHARELGSSSSAFMSGRRYLGTNVKKKGLGHHRPLFYNLSDLPSLILFKVLTKYIIA